MRTPSVNQYSFAQAPATAIARSSFRRSHTHKTAFDSQYLVPIFVDEVLPGDTFNLKLTSVARLATPIVPFMDNIHLDYFFFFVPNRLLWTNWEKFMGAQDDPGDSISFTVPQIAEGGSGFAEQSLADYFGIPIGVTGITPNSLHFRAYNLIWNEWFRSEDLQDSAVVDKDDGPDAIADYPLLKRGKRHDYFTSCLPWPEKNGTAIDLPLGTSAPIKSDGTAIGLTDGSTTTGLYAYNSAYQLGASNAHSGASVGANYSPSGSMTSGNAIGLHNAYPGMYADLNAATAASINSLREAFQLQKMLEKDARGGTRYTEIIRSHFQVVSPDARLQRPEYLGGGSTLMNIQAIAQTESSDASTPQGNLAAIGFNSQSGIGFTKSFVEHGVILGLVNARADITYQQGYHRMWTRQDREEFYFPSLANLGEQEVLSQEIYCDGSANDSDIFGYQERWAEYRYYPSKITSTLRSAAAASLDVWHLSEDFASRPTLNAAFIQDASPVSRVVATPTEPEIIFDGYFDIVCARPMPVFSIPGLIDHF